MSIKAERLTQRRIIAVEKYSENKIHAICVNKKGAYDLYVIWVKMIDLQKRLDHLNLCYAATKEMKIYCHTKHPTKDQVKKYKRKMDQWIKDDKIVYIREDIAYNLIRCINVTVKADEFRKNLGIKNNQLVLIEREIIAIIMKVFPKEVMVRQCKIDGLPYEVDLCFIVHKLVIEVDEDGHVFYDVKEHQI